ncbi:ATP-dependent DNA helicase PIF2-like protein, partial [Leptotrombidium deliense]
MLEYIHLRLVQIKQCDAPFGGISIIAFGDFNQLPPVAAPPVYKISDMIGTPLWWSFKGFELTEIMRQKDDKLFAKALTSYGNGHSLEPDEIALLESRYITNEAIIPKD